MLLKFSFHSPKLPALLSVKSLFFPSSFWGLFTEVSNCAFMIRMKILSSPPPTSWRDSGTQWQLQPTRRHSRSRPPAPPGRFVRDVLSGLRRVSAGERRVLRPRAGNVPQQVSGGGAEFPDPPKPLRALLGPQWPEGRREGRARRQVSVRHPGSPRR